MTFRAKEVIAESDTIVGYETYVNLVSDLIEGKEIHRYAMTQEVERAHQCIDLAKSGKIVWYGWINLRNLSRVWLESQR